MKLKLTKEKSRIYKYRALVWLRVQQRCPFMATEFGRYSADAYGCNEAKSYEVETKSSWGDFRSDFRKRHKHMTYTGEYDFIKKDYWVPQYFYFAVPSEIVEKVVNYLKTHDKYKNYGVIDGDSWSVVKRAKRIHDKPPAMKVKYYLALRMGSELLRFHEALL